MKTIADANVLIRALANDDELQSPLARAVLEQSELVVLTLPALCEFVWVMMRGYKESRSRVANAIRTLVAAANTEGDFPAIDAGLGFLDAGGDFADGVIAYEGRQLGGETFVSFDRQAVDLLDQQGLKALLPQ